MDSGELRPYIGHDTVCAIGLDQTGHMAACTSTSGLFYKRPGRVGDSPLPGCGFYVDNASGGACATGLGEDIMKGALSFQVVQLIGLGYSPQEACEQATRYAMEGFLYYIYTYYQINTKEQPHFPYFLRILP